ncbi:OLC1v1017422C1 [Oldenlandia corymbosa var. corymbosa]|uniref:OLC1v1017422C1 n=1 Tax=Oldenlandia corymbosa var. corymbosa TaxID=529605 RepID=A0AAV1E9G7_OLDCO|nr:OLC1v1017422C1 [Oldenlandia corymbosa var. corymbosa]
MSLPAQSNRRENRSRLRSNPVQSGRREWVPRAPASSSDDAVANTGTPTVTATIASTDMGPAVNGNVTNVGSNSRPVPPANSNRTYQGSRGIMGYYPNQRREREKEKKRDQNQEAQGSKDVNLPLLVQEIQDKLMKGTVECMICYDMVRRSAPIWSCSSCYSIFHLACIKKWARAPTSVDLSAEKSQGFNWRCPGCQAVQLTSSKEIRYVCYCRKRQDPSSDLYLTPHSCGEPCGKALEKEVPGSDMTMEDLCPHTCVLQCHPGPCPPCKAFAPPRRCPCGKKVITTRCSDRKAVLTCGQQCDKLLDCGRHHCKRTCHVGPCDYCEVMFNASCFCKKKTEAIVCGGMLLKGEIKVENGVFSCYYSCEKSLGCGNHLCNDLCHPGPCGECELLPSKISSCCCGKTKLEEDRRSCLDPIPTCSQICGKRLPCRLHYCKDTCHTGVCAPCPVLVGQKCRCGSTSFTVECYRTMTEEMFACDRPCGQKKSCGRHRCSDRCCPLSNSKNPVPSEWDTHLCDLPCGKKLRCGRHSCQSLCHSGHCPPCLNTIFTDLSCACGRTSIPPPQPCGTPPPYCQHRCSVPQPCGHPSSHSCHFGDCPPCTVPIAKECIGGHVVLRNIPCGSKDIRCNKICGKTRQCGLHACSRSCHPSPCDSPIETSVGKRASCGQPCGAPRRDCRHTCTALCHPSAPCPDIRCEFPVTISCSCGRISATVPCDAGGNNGGYSADTVLEASLVQKLPAPLQPVEANAKAPLGQRKLMCDDDCVKTERKKVLADAFGVTTSNLDALHFGETAFVPEVLSDVMRREPKWLLSVEERCKYLVLGRCRGGINALKVHVFCPMSKEKRDVLRLMADRWKLTVNAAGWEPKRFVILHVTPKSKAPARLLGAKVGNTNGILQPPVFDPSVDMDPRLVVALFDLPRDADISALVLRFGGECELVWLNDKNALAVFNDPARAATAMRRLDQGSLYYGAVVVLQNVGTLAVSSDPPRAGTTMRRLEQGSSVVPQNLGTASASNTSGMGGYGPHGGADALKQNPWKKVVMQEPDGGGSSWGAEEEWANNVSATNRWSALDSDSSSSSFSATTKRNNEGAGNKPRTTVVSTSETGNSSSSAALPGQQHGGGDDVDVVDDWEKAYD